MVKILHRHSESYYNKTIKIKNNGAKIHKNLLPLSSLFNEKNKKEIIKKIKLNMPVKSTTLETIETHNDEQSKHVKCHKI